MLWALAIAAFLYAQCGVAVACAILIRRGAALDEFAVALLALCVIAWPGVIAGLSMAASPAEPAPLSPERNGHAPPGTKAATGPRQPLPGSTVHIN